MSNQFSQFASDLLRVASGLDAKGRKAVQRVGKGAAASAAANAPRKSGKLASGIESKVEGLTATVTSDEYYSRFQEYGTSRMAPNPFMGPAVDRWEPELGREIEGIADEIAKDLS